MGSLCQWCVGCAVENQDSILLGVCSHSLLLACVGDENQGWQLMAGSQVLRAWPFAVCFGNVTEAGSSRQGIGYGML